MPDYKEILYEKQRGGALMTLNRPDAMNAISRSMIKEMQQALDEAEEDNEVRAVVLTGAGRAFSAGMDQGNRAGRRRDMHWPYGIVTGQTAAEVFRRVNPQLQIEVLQPDGTALTGGETILEVRGPARSILTAVLG